MTFRYIGSKSRLIDQIKAHIGYPKPGAFFVDGFCGTGVVAEAAAGLGWNVRINDNLRSAVISAGARLISGDKQLLRSWVATPRPLPGSMRSTLSMVLCGASTAPHRSKRAGLSGATLPKKTQHESTPCAR